MEIKWNLTNLKNEIILGILTKYLMYEILHIDVNYVYWMHVCANFDKFEY